jgi:hypothetical protein
MATLIVDLVLPADLSVRGNVDTTGELVVDHRTGGTHEQRLRLISHPGQLAVIGPGRGGAGHGSGLLNQSVSGRKAGLG